LQHSSTHLVKSKLETPIQDYHHDKLLPSLLHNAKIPKNQAKTSKKEAKEAANN